MTGGQLIGRTLARRFRVTGFIGDGAMATVYRAVQDAEPREVAIKVMQPHLATDPVFVGRFRREAKAASAFRHPNSVTVYDWGVDDGVLYIAMELLSGQDLFERLVLERRLSEAKAASILIDVCAALSAAHAQGIVHRDLKPENVMLVRDRDEREVVKVLDFGIAKILDSTAGEPMDREGMNSLVSSVVTRAGVAVGTPAYMSPEQCRGETIDGRTDVYACGVLLYQLLTGRLPFEGQTPIDLAMHHLHTPPPPPREHVSDLHAGLERVILKALAKLPADRHQSAAELSSELAALLPELRQSPSFVQPHGSARLLADRQPSEPSSGGDRAETLVRDDSGRAGDDERAILSPRRLQSLGGLGDDADTLASPKQSSPFPVVPPPVPEVSDGHPAGSAGHAAVPSLPDPPRRPAPPPSSLRRRAPALGPWLLVPVALAVGIGAGVALYVLTH